MHAFAVFMEFRAVRRKTAIVTVAGPYLSRGASQVRSSDTTRCCLVDTEKIMPRILNSFEGSRTTNKGIILTQSKNMAGKP